MADGKCVACGQYLDTYDEAGVKQLFKRTAEVRGGTTRTWYVCRNCLPGDQAGDDYTLGL